MPYNESISTNNDPARGLGTILPNTDLSGYFQTVGAQKANEAKLKADKDKADKKEGEKYFYKMPDTWEVYGTKVGAMHEETLDWLGQQFYENYKNTGEFQTKLDYKQEIEWQKRMIGEIELAAEGKDRQANYDKLAAMLAADPQGSKYDIGASSKNLEATKEMFGKPIDWGSILVPSQTAQKEEYGWGDTKAIAGVNSTEGTDGVSVKTRTIKEASNAMIVNYMEGKQGSKKALDEEAIKYGFKNEDGTADYEKYILSAAKDPSKAGAQAKSLYAKSTSGMTVGKEQSYTPPPKEDNNSFGGGNAETDSYTANTSLGKKTFVADGKPQEGEMLTTEIRAKKDVRPGTFINYTGSTYFNPKSGKLENRDAGIKFEAMPSISIESRRIGGVVGYWVVLEDAMIPLTPSVVTSLNTIYAMNGKLVELLTEGKNASEWNNTFSDPIYDKKLGRYILKEKPTETGDIFKQ